MTNHEQAEEARLDAIEKHFDNISYYIADEIMVFIKSEVKAIMRLIYGADLVEENERLREENKRLKHDRVVSLDFSVRGDVSGRDD